MFYFDEYKGQKILRSSLLDEINAFFTLKQDSAFNFGNGRVVTPEQVHGCSIEVIDNRDNYPETDGLICRSKNLTYYLRFADCTPLILYDTKNKISAISHAGWRGTALKIGVKTLDKMCKIFGTEPKDVTAAIGAAISVCCYEVSEDVKSSLLSTVNNKDGLFKDNNVDLKKINARQLTEAGVNSIDICPYCTSCDNDLFYSYRKENGTKKRHFAVIVNE